MILSGTWCDVTRTGRIVRSVGARVEEVAGIYVPAPDELLFLRADDGPHGLVLAGIGAHSGHAWLWHRNVWEDLGAAHGNHAVETDGTHLWVARAPDVYEVHDLTTGTRDTRSMPWTSQGFCDCTVPALLFSDQARPSVPYIYRPQAAGAWRVGGARDTYDVLAVFNGTPWLVEAGVAPIEEVRAVEVGNEIVACAWTRDGVWTWHGVPSQAWQPPVTPNPNPDPDPNPDPMATPQHIIDIMVAAGRRADELYPGLRQSNNDAWMQHAAGLACAKNPDIGRKSRSPGSRVSPDTMAYITPAGMYCVSIIRDNPPTNEWRSTPLDYGLVEGQHFVSVPPEQDVVDPPDPPPVDPPPSSTVEARLSALEAWARGIAYVS